MAWPPTLVQNVFEGCEITALQASTTVAQSMPVKPTLHTQPNTLSQALALGHLQVFAQFKPYVFEAQTKLK